MPIRFQVDPDFYDHPKTTGMSDAAFSLWVRAGSFSAAKLTDGFISEDVLVLTLRSSTDVADELARRGLWRRVKGGYRFHEWSQRNLTKTRVDADREYDRDRKRRERQRATRNGKPQPDRQIVQPDSDRNPPGLQPESERSPHRSVSVSVSESVSGSGRGVNGSPAPLAAQPPPRCPEHLDNPNPPPCGPCADARRRRERWELADAERRRNAPQCARHRGQPAATCGLCRSERLAVKEPA